MTAFLVNMLAMNVAEVHSQGHFPLQQGPPVENKGYLRPLFVAALLHLFLALLCCTSAIDYPVQFRNLLRKEPILLHFGEDGRVSKIGGPEQCTENLLRTVLARMHNWVQLVNEVIRAELPAFEMLSSMTSLLQVEEDPDDLDEAVARVAKVLKLPADSLQGIS